MIYPANFEQKIGFDKIRRMVEARCVTQCARQKLEEVRFSTSFEAIQQALLLTDEMRVICLMEESFPDTGYVDVIHFLEKIRIIGRFLEPEELFDLKKALDTVKQITAFFKRQEEGKYPTLTAQAASVMVFPAVSDKIDSIVNRFGKIKDNASPELQRIRRSIIDTQSQIGRKIQAILKSAQSQGLVEDDASISIREGRMVIPVLASNKRKIKGFVHDESATGRTAYIEPVEVVELNNEVKELEYAERREIIKILTAFSDFLRPYLDDIIQAGDFLGEIDLLRAKALFATEIEAVRPILLPELVVDWQRARHPLLLRALRKEKKEVVPLSMRLNADKHILVISGPNAGGKSVCLKTVGLLQYMLQCGFLVSASENSEVGVFNDIFIDIGDEQSIENDLSTYSSHLLNMRNVLQHAKANSLVLIDEFGTGTEPTVGGAIAEAVLQKLVERKTFAVITTHYTNLKYFASSNPGVVNGAMLFDVQKIQPLFKLEIGSPGSSFAFEIARKIGLPEDVLNLAEQKVGDDYVDMERSLRRISRDKRYWEEKRSRIRQTDKYLEELTAKYEKELKELKDKRKDILQKAKDEAKLLLDNTNKEIENTIRSIRESQAEKEKTKKVRQQLDSFKQEVVTSDKAPENKEIDRKIEQLKARQQRKAERNAKQTGEAADPDSELAVVSDEPVIEIGAKVMLDGQSTPGEIVKLNGNNAVVAFDSLFVTAKTAKLKPITNNEFRKLTRDKRPAVNTAGYNVSMKRLNFKRNVDLRGMRTDEALEEVRDFIDEAMMIGVDEVRILHGKGTGALKHEIRNYLRSVGGIKSLADEAEDMGGAGITVVKFE